MGNGDKIKKLPKELGSTFLPDEIRDVDGKIEVYSLKGEFAKTNKNKSYRLYIMISIFIIVIGLFALIFTKYLMDKDNNIPINIRAFEDLRLKEVLESAKLDEVHLEMANLSIQSLRIEMLNKVLGIRKKSLIRELDIIAMNIPQVEKEAKLKMVREKEEHDISQMEAQYKNKIIQEKKKLLALESEFRENRESIKKKKAEGHVINEDRLHNLKMEKLRNSWRDSIKAIKDYYENHDRYLTLLYNPVFRSSRLKDIINRRGGEAAVSVPDMTGYKAHLYEKSGFTKERFNILRNAIEEDFLLAERLRSIPNVNSVAPSIRAINSLTRDIVKGYEELWGSLSSSIDGYEYATQHFLENNKSAQGIVLDGRNPRSVKVDIMAGQNVRPGDLAKVVRKKGGRQKYVGTLQFISDRGGLRGKMIEQKLDPEPFDLLILRKKK